jgi:hypothetical protein
MISLVAMTAIFPTDGWSLSRLLGQPIRRDLAGLHLIDGRRERRCFAPTTQRRTNWMLRCGRDTDYPAPRHLQTDQSSSFGGFLWAYSLNSQFQINHSVSNGPHASSHRKTAWLPDTLVMPMLTTATYGQ